MGQQLSRKHVYKKMPRLSEDHLLPSKLQRYKRGHTFAERAQSAVFNQVDDILDEVYCDICNGVARSDITQKLMKGMYEPQKGQQKQLTYRQAQEYYNCALDRMHYNTDLELAELKDIFYNRYESLLEAAVRKGDLFNARGTLDSMAKIFLTGDFKHGGGRHSSIEVNTDDDGKIVIKFGFNDDDNVEDQDFEEINEQIVDE